MYSSSSVADDLGSNEAGSVCELFWLGFGVSCEVVSSLPWRVVADLEDVLSVASGADA